MDNNVILGFDSTMIRNKGNITKTPKKTFKKRTSITINEDSEGCGVVVVVGEGGGVASMEVIMKN